MSSHVKGCDVMCVTHSPFFSSSSDLSTAGTGHICVRHTGSYTHQIKSCHIKSHHIKYIYILLISFLSFLSIHPSILHYHTSYHIISHDVISYDNILYHVLTLYYVLYHVVLYHVLYQIIPYHLILQTGLSYFIISCRIISSLSVAVLVCMYSIISICSLILRIPIFLSLLFVITSHSLYLPLPLSHSHSQVVRSMN